MICTSMKYCELEVYFSCWRCLRLGDFHLVKNDMCYWLLFNWVEYRRNNFVNSKEIDLSLKDPVVAHLASLGLWQDYLVTWIICYCLRTLEYYSSSASSLALQYVRITVVYVAAFLCLILIVVSFLRRQRMALLLMMIVGWNWLSLFKPRMWKDLLLLK